MTPRISPSWTTALNLPQSAIRGGLSLWSSTRSWTSACPESGGSPPSWAWTRNWIRRSLKRFNWVKIKIGVPHHRRSVQSPRVWPLSATHPGPLAQNVPSDPIGSTSAPAVRYCCRLAIEQAEQSPANRKLGQSVRCPRLWPPTNVKGQI